jgi:hypothetical protein
MLTGSIIKAEMIKAVRTSENVGQLLRVYTAQYPTRQPAIFIYAAVLTNLNQQMTYNENDL